MVSPLCGGELVIVFLAARVALWIWRSRKQLAALAHDDGPGGPDGGGRRLPPALRLVPPARVGGVELRRAA
jgi:hypothetical protein